MQISHNRKSALGLILSICIILCLCPVAFAVPAQGDEAAQESELCLLSECSEQLSEIEIELEAAEAAAIEAAKPDSVKRAESCIGVPYRSGSSSPYGFDCSGMVSYCLTGNYGHAYTSYAFWNMPAVGDPQPGDVVACSPGHCGLYIGDGLMIHAPQSGETVRIEAIRGKVVRP